ncbi:hypothetical protein LSH36_26g04065 [Paralvinella palmiformis]|uniref:Uncharacterized protein n=1 Tax=Paralvinella palmiformis TaxID=53620 RepID=A0AAD9KAL0_9ANNE|nr:hypothetical protein LSH36_26g04065 [Paralvinella palmiformis]
MDEEDYDEGWQTDLNKTENEKMTPWRYQDMFTLDGIPVWGNVASYSGGGYVAELGTKPGEALKMIQYLRDTRWLDRSSRALFVEFNLYNPNTNLFSIVTLGLEFPASGGVIPFPVVQTLRLYNYVGSRAIFRIFLDLTFVAFTLYFIVVEGRKMRQQKQQYFKGFWNILELFNLVGSVLVCAMYGVHYVFSRHTIAKFRDNKGTFGILRHDKY